ncbi:MAG: hypothetical protein CR977_00030 [Gammaproteobacteria bacterium]|nr:MAG: hypothetical protein CR977_00030 [Gammaproteobacteria bacterium]
MRLIRLLLRECRDYVQYFVIPALAVVMPWWLAIRFFRLVAYIPFLYRQTSQLCLVGARHLQLIEASGMSEAAWLRACKVGQIIDYADIFMLVVGRKDYWQRYVTENFSGLFQAQQMIFTPHYGAGMWVYWYLRQQGCLAVMFANRPRSNNADARLGRLRFRVLEKLGAVIVSPDNLQALRPLLRQQATIIVGPDIPVAEGVKFYRPLTDLGYLNLTARFFDLAEKRNLQVLNIVFSVDIDSGQREFEARLLTGETAQNYAAAFARQSVEAIKKRSYLWRMLVAAPQVMLPLDDRKISQ